MPAKDGQKIEAEAGEEPPLKKKKRAKPSQEELEYSRNHQKSRAENSKEEQTAKAEDERKGTKHWRPSQDAPPKVTQAENVASNALQAGRCIFFLFLSVFSQTTAKCQCENRKRGGRQ